MADQVTCTFGGRQCLNPYTLRRTAEANGWDISSWWDKRPNGFSLFQSRAVGIGYVLMRKQDVDALDRSNKQAFVLACGSQSLTLPAMVFVEAKSVYAFSATSYADTPYLVEFADKRILATKESFFARTGSIAKQAFNVRAHVPTDTSGAGLYTYSSLKSGTAYTWQEVIDTVWKACTENNAATLTNWSFPTGLTLPATPDGTPENLIFCGMNCWDAFQTLLDRLSLCLDYNPIADTFALNKLGTTQSSLSSLSQYNSQLAAIQDTIRNPILRNPAQYYVDFPYKQDQVGNKNYIGGSSGDDQEAIDTIDFAAGAVASSSPKAGNYLPVRDTLDKLAGSSTIVTARTTAVSNRATAVATEIKNRLENAGTPLRKKFIGIITATLTGSQVRGVRWEDTGDPINGVTTEIWNDDDPFMQNLMNNEGYRIHHNTKAEEILSPPMLARYSYADRVPMVAVCYITDETRNSDGYYEGDYYTDWATGSDISPGSPLGVGNTACWLIATDASDAVTAVPVLLSRGTDMVGPSAWIPGHGVVGRLLGYATSGGSTRPLFTIDTEQYRLWYLVKATANWVDGGGAGDTVSVKIINADGSLDGTTRTCYVGLSSSGDMTGVKNFNANVYTDDKFWAKLRPNGTMICLEPGFIDDPVGTLKMFRGATAPRGWGFANSVGNAAPYGSGVNYNDGRVLGTGASVAPTPTHTHTAHGTTSFNYQAGATASGTLLIDTNNHASASATPAEGIRQVVLIERITA